MTSPYAFIKQGNLYVAPVTNEVPYPTPPITKPREFSLWVHGRIEEPAFQLDRVRMPPSLYQEVRNDLVRFSPVEVSRSAFRRSQHAYVGVIDSKGKPFYFALDSRGMSVREVSIDDTRVWKTFDQLADDERGMALQQRRSISTKEMVQVDRELSEPRLIIVKSDFNWKRKTKERVGKKRMLTLTKAEAHTGTMVSLHLPREIAEQIAIPGGEDSASMHITLAYLGKDLTEEQKSAALCAVRRFAQQAGPIHVVLGGVGRFSASHTSEGRDVVYLSVDSPDITRLHPKLLEELAAEGIEPSNAHGFVPHVTLAYVEMSASTPIKRFPPLTVEFPSVSLTVADQQMQFPFTKTDPALIITFQKAIRFHHAPGGTYSDDADASHGTYEVHSKPKLIGAGKKHVLMYYPLKNKKGESKYSKQKLSTHSTLSDAHAAADAHHQKQSITKALPRKAKEETVKKTPTKTASSKKAGAGGKTRYSYPNEKKKKPGASGAKKPAKPQPLLVVHDDSKHADPSELANQLGVSIRTLTRCAKQHGREGFSKFMRSHLKRFSAKHRLDPDYWGTLYEKLQPGVG